MPTEWQWTYLKDNESVIGTSGTIRVKLPIRDQVSVIDVEANCLPKADNYDYNILDIIKKIEVIGDGASVLYSSIPETASFHHLCQVNSMPNHLNKDCYPLRDSMRVKLCFGRWQRDEVFGLDTGVYNNVYLEMPWEINETYYTKDELHYTVRYLRPIERLPWTGFIRTRDIEYDAPNWAAVGHYYVDLPLKYPWYTLATRIYKKDDDLADIMRHIRLDIDDGRMILVDDDIDDLLTVNTERLPYPVHVMHECAYLSAGGGAGFVRSYLGDIDQVEATPIAAAPKIIPISAMTGQRVEFFPMEASSGAAETVSANVSIWGSAYMCCLIIKDWWAHPRFPQPMEPFPVADHSQAQIDYHHEDPGQMEDIRTILQEVCPAKI